MQIDWKIRLLNWLLRRNKPIDQLSSAELRQVHETVLPGWMTRLLFGQLIPLAQITDQRVLSRQGEIPIRLYSPSLQYELPAFLSQRPACLC